MQRNLLGVNESREDKGSGGFLLGFFFQEKSEKMLVSRFQLVFGSALRHMFLQINQFLVQHSETKKKW